MAFTRIRTINGHQYEYEEHRWREGGKVRSKSIYKGKRFQGTVQGKGTHEERTAMGEIAAERAADKSKREWENKQKAEAVKAPAQEITLVSIELPSLEATDVETSGQ